MAAERFISLSTHVIPVKYVVLLIITTKKLSASRKKVARGLRRSSQVEEIIVKGSACLMPVTRRLLTEENMSACLMPVTSAPSDGRKHDRLLNASHIGAF